MKISAMKMNARSWSAQRGFNCHGFSTVDPNRSYLTTAAKNRTISATMLRAKTTGQPP